MKEGEGGEGGGGGERRRGNIFASLTRTSKTGWRAEKREYIRPLDTNKTKPITTQHNLWSTLAARSSGYEDVIQNAFPKQFQTTKCKSIWNSGRK